MGWYAGYVLYIHTIHMNNMGLHGSFQICIFCVVISRACTYYTSIISGIIDIFRHETNFISLAFQCLVKDTQTCIFLYITSKIWSIIPSGLVVLCSKFFFYFSHHYVLLMKWSILANCSNAWAFHSSNLASLQLFGGKNTCLSILN